MILEEDIRNEYNSLNYFEFKRSLRESFLGIKKKKEFVPIKEKEENLF
jgi:hypothetical protein